MQFWKVQALGNDFVLFDDTDNTLDLPPATIAALCDRHMGVGADGLLIVRPGDAARGFEYEMVYYNADGSLAEMCGNGIRCFAKFLFDHDFTKTQKGLSILTGAGIKVVDLGTAGGKAKTVRVNMGPPAFERPDIPITGEGEAIDEPISVNGSGDFRFTGVSMGNPHCVILVDNVDTAPVTTAGPKIEHHPMFPERTNVQFVQPISRTEVRARIWERGVGETLASGTSSCAITAAGVKLGILDRHVKVRLPGGELDIEWTDQGDIYMTGGAEEVFSGEIDISALGNGG